MKRILIVGCGDIAMRVVPLLQGRYQLLGLARRTERFAKLRAMGITPLLCDLDDRASLVRIAGLADVVLHFAPPFTAQRKQRPPLLPLGEAGAEERRLVTAERESDARTRNLLSVLSRGKLPEHLIYISTSGVYGDCGGIQMSETYPLNPQTARAQLRVNAEQQIRSWAKRNHVNASILRVPGIYAVDRLPLDRLRAGTPNIAAIDDSFTNLIHADDLARIVVAVLRYAKPNRVYHASDGNGIKMGDYFDAVADTFGLPRLPRLPRVEVEHAVSPMLWSFMNESRRLTNERIKQELKVKLCYPTVVDALASIRKTDYQTLGNA